MEELITIEELIESAVVEMIARDDIREEIRERMDVISILTDEVAELRASALEGLELSAITDLHTAIRERYKAQLN